MKFIYRVKKQQRRWPDDPAPGLYLATDIVVLLAAIVVMAAGVAAYLWRAW